MSGLQRQRGGALFTALFLVLALATVGAAVAVIGTSGQVSSGRALDLTRVYYATRGGLEEAITIARGDDDCAAVEGQNTTVDGFTVSWECTVAPITERNENYRIFTITATGVSGSKASGTLVRRRLQVQATDFD